MITGGFSNLGFYNDIVFDMDGAIAVFQSLQKVMRVNTDL